MRYMLHDTQLLILHIQWLDPFVEINVFLRHLWTPGVVFLKEKCPKLDLQQRGWRLWTWGTTHNVFFFQVVRSLRVCVYICTCCTRRFPWVSRCLRYQRPCWVSLPQRAVQVLSALWGGCLKGKEDVLHFTHKPRELCIIIIIFFIYQLEGPTALIILPPVSTIFFAFFVL